MYAYMHAELNHTHTHTQVRTGVTTTQCGLERGPFCKACSRGTAATCTHFIHAAAQLQPTPSLLLLLLLLVRQMTG